jgi:hypothetical protein
VAIFTAVARSALVMVVVATEAGGGRIVKSTIDVAGGAPPMFIDYADA